MRINRLFGKKRLRKAMALSLICALSLGAVNWSMVTKKAEAVKKSSKQYVEDMLIYEVSYSYHPKYKENHAMNVKPKEAAQNAAKK